VALLTSMHRRSCAEWAPSPDLRRRERRQEHGRANVRFTGGVELLPRLVLADATVDGHEPMTGRCLSVNAHTNGVDTVVTPAQGQSRTPETTLANADNEHYVK